MSDFETLYVNAHELAGANLLRETGKIKETAFTTLELDVTILIP